MAQLIATMSLDGKYSEPEKACTFCGAEMQEDAEGWLEARDLVHCLPLGKYMCPECAKARRKQGVAGILLAPDA